MKWRGLPFTGEMVRATRAGLKTETRRVIRPQPTRTHSVLHGELRPDMDLPRCPYGVPGDGLYVREAFAACRRGPEHPGCIEYRADEMHGPAAEAIGDSPKWSPSIHMPRWASRQGLILTDVAVERVQQITAGGAMAEGVGPYVDGGAWSPIDRFCVLWDRINGPRGYGWDANPWVWRLRYGLTDELPPPLETRS